MLFAPWVLRQGQSDEQSAEVTRWCVKAPGTGGGTTRDSTPPARAGNAALGESDTKAPGDKMAGTTGVQTPHLEACGGQDALQVAQQHSVGWNRRGQGTVGKLEMTGFFLYFKVG